MFTRILIMSMLAMTLDAPAIAAEQSSKRPGGRGSIAGVPKEICAPRMLHFDGAYRKQRWFERRFVTAGASLEMLQGSDSTDSDEGIVIVEVPNARTTTIRAISSQPAGQQRLTTRHYMSGYEVLEQYTPTGGQTITAHATS